MKNPQNNLTEYLLTRLAAVQRNLGIEPTSANAANARFADVIDSMGMVEFLAVVAEDCAASPEQIEKSVGRQFGTVAELAAAMHTMGILPRGESQAASVPVKTPAVKRGTATAWLSSTAVRLPDAIEPAAAINKALERPESWLEKHAGIRQRRTWREQDPLQAAAEAGNEALELAGLTPAQVGALLVVSEAPPVLLGLAAALHHRLRLPSQAVALDIGGACTGFLCALWAAQGVLSQREIVLLLSVEAATQNLRVAPGPAGESAALFGDAAAATILCSSPVGSNPLPLQEVCLNTDGGLAHLLQIERSPDGGVELRMRGTELASRAIDVMAQSVSALAKRHGFEIQELAAVIAHGGNGRMPALLARKLWLPPDRVWSETATNGNLGSASLPVAWAMHQSRPRGPVVWTAVGAGLMWGAALFGATQGAGTASSG